MIHELGDFVYNHIEHPIINRLVRLLGFTAAGLELLLDEVYDTDSAAKRWEEL